MEDSTSNTLQEIEKLKQKISAYRDALMTLKMGTSLEDYLAMKKEFDVLKTQISYIEGLTQTVDEKQHTQNEIYEEQMKQFSLQLAVLKQTVKEMNQEILSISNKISTSEEVSEKDTLTLTKHEKNSTEVNDIQPTDDQSSTISNQPSYKQLRNLTSQVLQPQKIQENIDSFEQPKLMGNQKDQRYFNQRYFQSINTHPNHIYNGLYKNTLGKTPLRFKNTDEIQDSPTNDPKNSISPSIDRVPKNVNSTVLNPIEPLNKSVDASNANEESYHDSVKIQSNLVLAGNVYTW